MILIRFIIHFLIFLFGNNKYVNFQNMLCNNKFVPPAWSLYGGADNFNIAFPDIAAMYTGSFVCVGPNQTITLESDVPYARYYSVQIYDSTTASLGSLNDHEINVVNNKIVLNITKNLTNQINLTNNSSNTTNTLHITTSDNFLILIFRVYDVTDFAELDTLHNISQVGRNKTFGWIEPPNLFRYENNKKIAIPKSSTYAKIAFPRIYRNVEPIKSLIFNNTNNNFFKPYSSGYFSNDDANYLVSTISLHNSTTNKAIGAIIKGYLPLTNYNHHNRTNYFKQNNDSFDYLHDDYYEVKYLSFNMGTLSMPLPTVAGPMFDYYEGYHQTIVGPFLDYYKKYHGFTLYDRNVDPKLISSTGKPGITDKDIVKKYNNSQSWHLAGRPYTIYIGLNLSHIEKLGGDTSTDLYMIYPTHYETTKPFTYPVVIFRNLMSQTRFLTKPVFQQCIGSITKPFATPTECEQVMGKYYPTIEFYYV